ncbi:MAG: hypothetical protein JOY71_18920 [Acetobacteraceae bacterium]|nr:hypothetical protein [Acetobacteraceae bacterium]MBV8524166.1 hypothetical protein [Acetobacteraceae bacterium]
MKFRTNLKPLPSNPASEPEFTSQAAIEEELRHVDSERARLKAVLDGLPGKEQELLEQDAGDEIFSELDVERRRAERGLARLNILEQKLVGRARELAAAVRQARWHELVAEYHIAAEAFIASVKQTGQLHQRVESLSMLASNEGFVLGMQSLLPLPPPLLRPDAASWYEASVRSLSEHPPPSPAGAPATCSIRFVKGWNNCNAGETAGFPDKQAWMLVDMGVGEFAQDRIPPRPAGPPPELQRVVFRPLGK